MSLGINTLWTARIHVASIAGLSSIPRETRTSSRRLLVFSRRLITSEANSLTAAEKPVEEHGTQKPDQESSESGEDLIKSILRTPLRDSGGVELARINPIRNYAYSLETRQSMRRHHETAKAQEIADAPDKYHTTDWRHVLDNLMRRTFYRGPDWIDDAAQVSFPFDLHLRVREDLNQVLAVIRRQYCCEIRVLEVIQGSAQRALSVSGPLHSVNKAVRVLLNLDSSVVVMKGSASLGLDTDALQTATKSQRDYSTPTISSTAILHSGGRRRFEDPSLSDLELPPFLSTKVQFVRYVAELTSGRMARAPGQQQHRLPHVASSLQHLFVDMNVGSAMSTTGGKMALKYLSRGKIRFHRISEEIIHAMENFQVLVDASVFNKVLMGTALSNNILLFDRITQLMEERGISANLSTWMAFLETFHAEDAVRIVLKMMARKGLLRSPLLSEYAWGRIANLMAANDADRACKMGEPVGRFLSQRRKRYGAQFLHGHKAMLATFLQYGRFRDVEVILFESNLDSSQLSTTTLNTILTHCKRQRRLHIAISFLRKLQEPGSSMHRPVRLDRESHRILFRLASHAKFRLHTEEAAWAWAHYETVAAVVWYYAVLAGHMSVNPSAPRLQRLLATVKLVCQDQVSSPPPIRHMVPDLRDHAGSAVHLQVELHRTYMDWEPALPMGVMMQIARDRDLARARKQAIKARESTDRLEPGSLDAEEVTPGGVVTEDDSLDTSDESRMNLHEWAYYDNSSKRDDWGLEPLEIPLVRRASRGLHGSTVTSHTGSNADEDTPKWRKVASQTRSQAVRTGIHAAHQDANQITDSADVGRGTARNQARLVRRIASTTRRGPLSPTDALSQHERVGRSGVKRRVKTAQQTEKTIHDTMGGSSS
jgi:hypothetical protein